MSRILALMLLVIPSCVWGQEVVPSQIVPDAPEVIVEFESEPEPVYRSRIVFRGERRLFGRGRVRGVFRGSCGIRGCE